MKTVEQFLRFSVIGGIATGTHLVIALACNEMMGLSALIANFLAFIAAIPISYCGNHHWTFCRQGMHNRYLPRFLLIALIGAMLNQLIVYIVVERGRLSYRLALAVVVLVIPLLSFTLNRIWVFAAKTAD